MIRNQNEGQVNKQEFVTDLGEEAYQIGAHVLHYVMVAVKVSRPSLCSVELEYQCGESMGENVQR